VHTGGWYGRYKITKPIPEGWEVAVQFWVGLGCSSPFPDRVIELLEEGKIILLLLSCSNVCVRYGAVIAPKATAKQIREELLNRYGENPGSDHEVWHEKKQEGEGKPSPRDFEPKNQEKEGGKMKTIYILVPLSKEAEEWIEENLHYEDWQIVGNMGIAIDHRYIDPIVEAMEEEGLVNDKDFEIL